MTEHVSCRLPAALGEQLDSAAAKNGSFRSELVRRAIRYYLRENPDEIDVLARQSRGAAAQPSKGSSAMDNRSRSKSPYDPMEDLS